MYNQIRTYPNIYLFEIALTITYLQKKSSSMSTTCNKMHKKVDQLLGGELVGTI